MPEFLKNRYGLRTSIINKKLCLFFPDAHRPVLWHLDEKDFRSATVKIKRNENGNFILALQNEAAADCDLACFFSYGNAQKALNAVGKTLMGVHAIDQTLRADKLNIFMMLLSCALAYILPFELALYSYAFLGPAHYLTQISWMHDRKYFAGSPMLFFPFLAMTMAIALNRFGYWEYASHIYILVLITALSISIAVIHTRTFKLRLMLTGFLILFFLSVGKYAPGPLYAFLLLVPTVIHVYFFTGFFILKGALKSQNGWAILSLIVFIACGMIFFIAAPAAHVISPDYVKANIGFFATLVKNITDILSFSGKVNPLSALGFLSFAYTYHYLNWFTKVNVIRWNDIPRQRLVFIIALYLMSISLYLVNYQLGLSALFALSLLHVFLELPLNILTVKTIMMPGRIS